MRRLKSQSIRTLAYLAKGPGFFKKRDKGMFEDNRPFLWAIEDPQDETNDLGRNSYACRQVKSAFEHAFTVITAPVDSRHGFLLRRIVKMDPTWCKGRKPPKNPGAIRGVALDFPQYIDLGRKRAAREQKQTAEKEARGKKRARVDETPEEENVSEEDITVSESEEGQAEEETPKTKKKTKRGKRGTAHKQRTPGYFAKGRPNKKQKTVSSQ